MEKKYILALDQGTSSSRAILFDKNQKIVAQEQQEFPQYYPQTGWVEHNPEEIWQSQINVARNLINKLGIKAEEIAAVGITNQRETTIVWDKTTGRPVYNAIVWQDRRTSDVCDAMKKDGLTDYVRENTGLVIDAYFSGTKIKWILENALNADVNIENLLFGTVDTWLVWKLTGGKTHVTDFSNASRTLIYNIKKLSWDKTLLNYLNIPETLLPQVKNSSEVVGVTDIDFFGAEIPIAGIAGDQQAALFGQNCIEPGMAKNTYGTGCFMLMNTGQNLIKSNAGLISTIAWGIDNRIEYALEGSVFIAGAAVKWLRDGLKIIQSASDTEEMALDAENSGGIYVVPAFAGLGAPYWDMYARGAIMGITQGINQKHIVRATLEAIAYQSKDILNAMMTDSGIELKSLNVDGGAVANNFLMQFQADILNTNVVRPEIIETTALGAALLAGLATGFWTKEDMLNYRSINRTFVPKFDENTRIQLYKGWKKAIERSKNWIDSD